MEKEFVLVLPKYTIESIAKIGEYGLFNIKEDELLNAVALYGSFIDREKAEQNYKFKQIIPYALFKIEKEYFVLKRTKNQSETRLHDKYSLGIGGHINSEESSSEKNIIYDGLFREIKEEVNIEEVIKAKYIGLINDDTTDVGRVHLGVLFVIELKNKVISIKETDYMTGSWYDINTIKDHFEYLESWSKIVFEFIANNENLY